MFQILHDAVKFKNSLAWVITFLFLVTASCAGRPAQPVVVYQPDDASRSCEELEGELERIEVEITELIPQTDKVDRNTGLAVAGVFLLVPAFFMDLSKAEQVEVNALIKRYNHLIDIELTKHCDNVRQQLPEFERIDY